MNRKEIIDELFINSLTFLCLSKMDLTFLILLGKTSVEYRCGSCLIYKLCLFFVQIIMRKLCRLRCCSKSADYGVGADGHVDTASGGFGLEHEPKYLGGRANSVAKKRNFKF